jgi:hypothetical protein
LEQALSAKGGGEAALLRASTAAWANANSDDVNFVIDASALKGGVTEAYGLDPTSLDYAAQLDAALTAVLQTLDIIDKSNDGIIQNHEVTNVVQDVYDATGFWGTTNYFSWGDLEAVTKALDSMNNMPHVDSGLFVV